MRFRSKLLFAAMLLASAPGWSQTAHKVALTWKAPSTSPNYTVVGYNVYRSLDNSQFTKLTSATVATTAYADTAVTGGTTYYYYVTAVGSNGGESLTSNIFEAFVPPISQPNNFTGSKD